MGQCAHPRCEVQAQPGQLACRNHWFQLPKPLRDAIWSTWRNRGTNGLGAYSENVLSARKFWADATPNPESDGRKT